MSRRAFAAGLAAVFLAGWVLRAVCVEQYGASHPQADRPVIDEASYDRWASEIAAGDWLGDDVFFQEPLYAYALGLVYTVGPEDSRRGRARHVQAVLGAATGVLAALATAAAFGPAAGLVAGGLWALYRPGLLFAALLLKPALALPLVALLALVVARSAARAEETGGVGLDGARALGLGVLAGLGGLVRGNLLLLVPVFVLLPVGRAVGRRRPLREALRPALLVAAGAAAAIAPATVRNRVVSGQLVPVTSGAGTNLYGGNNAENPYGVATEFDWIRGIPEYEPDDWRREAERRSGRPMTGADASAFWLGETARSVRANPGLHLAILARKARATLGRYQVPDNHHLDWDARFVPVLRAPLPGFSVAGWLGLAGALLFALRGGAPVRSRAAGRELLILAAAYFGTIVLTVTSMRARLVLVPLLLPFAGWFVVTVAARARALGPRGPRGLLEAAAALALAALAVFVPVFDAARVRSDLVERDFNLAAQLVNSGEDLERAGEIVAGLLREQPDHPRVAVLAADLDFRLGRRVLERPDATDDERASARRRIEEALRRVDAVDRTRAKVHERFRLDVLAGSILQYAGRWDEALARYDRASAFDDEDFELRYARALCRAEAAAAAVDPGARRVGLEEAAEALRALEREAPEDGDVARLRERVEAALAQSE